ncbi:hypothetical protein DMA12_45645 [Amycolatopsis balhimycina DSM 5908]|uniref:Uncharacterized protein n=1 Tax=Amycolatopsis balhimycina DSM 5908 TaxID=1081091 RepID=A0A428VW91_AMYBA|nr:hypothetical protein [Amycolatopsis balhimycina]RSM35067.1 hypothetical protein DMA12_45645 [Amycolatopsis balhimycina DSM 5908]
MHEDDRQLLDRIIVTARDCGRVVDVLTQTPPDSAMFVARLRRLSDELGALPGAISRRLSHVDVDAVEKTIRDVFDELTEPPEPPEATDANVLDGIRSAADTLAEHAKGVLQKDPPPNIVAVELAMAFGTLEMLSMITAIRAAMLANPINLGPDGDGA